MLGFIKHKDTEGIRIGRKVLSFTLIEAVMVIVILGILVVLARPRFEVFKDIKIRTGAKKLIIDMRYARSLSISRHEDYAVSFNPSGNSYRVYRSSDGVLAKDPFTNTDLSVDFDTDSTYKGIDIFSVDFDSDTLLRFNWQGIPYNSGGNELSNTGTVDLRYIGRRLVINVAPQTGRISWQWQ